MKNLIRLLALCLVPAAIAADRGQPSWDLPPPAQDRPVIWREHWYARGLTNGNPKLESRFRVNSPELVLHKLYGRREEARANGLMLIPAEEDLFQLTGAELYLESWGGHPGTANKRVTVNGRSTYDLPRVGAEDGHCTYGYPVIQLGKTDLVNGWNAFQFALDLGHTFWGHMIIDEACLRVALTNGHPDLVKAGLDAVAATVRVTPRAGPDEGFDLTLDLPAAPAARVARVDFQGWYTGFDDNGNRRETDWHGFTKDKKPQGYLGSATQAPWSVSWDTSMLPAQANVAVRAIVRFTDLPDLALVTAAAGGLSITPRAGVAVTLIAPPDLPGSFWSRARQLKSCSLVLDIDPSQIERAELAIKTWTGGAGEVRDYFKLNGQFLPVAEGSKHVVQYSRLPIEPSLLRRGTNRVELLSDTEHHGIEIIWPGPALTVRHKLR
jgi:hypothetical protein